MKLESWAKCKKATRNKILESEKLTDRFFFFFNFECEGPPFTENGSAERCFERIVKIEIAFKKIEDLNDLFKTHNYSPLKQNNKIFFSLNLVTFRQKST